MRLKDNKKFTLPGLLTGSFSGLDRIHVPLNSLILKEIFQSEENGDIEIISKANDGPEFRRGWIHFKRIKRAKKDKLCKWFAKQIGRDIETVYNSEFNRF